MNTAIYHPRGLIQPQKARRGRGILIWLGLWIGISCLVLIGGWWLFTWRFPLEPTNILLLGLDQRPDETTVSRTDTIMLLRLDSRANTIHTLSFPRDLWVDIPGVGENRINAAHFFAEGEEEGSGPKAVTETIAQNFGVPISYYARIDFQGFEDLVDAIGGIEVTVDEYILDMEYPTEDYGTQIVEFQVGTQWFNGERALQYARVRHNSTDFARAQRQQQVIQAFLKQLQNPFNWWRLPGVLQAGRESVFTNITPNLMLHLLPGAIRSGGNMERFVLDENYVYDWETEDGAWVLLPQMDMINPLLVEKFGKTGE